MTYPPLACCLPCSMITGQYEDIRQSENYSCWFRDPSQRLPALSKLVESDIMNLCEPFALQGCQSCGTLKYILSQASLNTTDINMLSGGVCRWLLPGTLPSSKMYIHWCNGIIRHEWIYIWRWEINTNIDVHTQLCGTNVSQWFAVAYLTVGWHCCPHNRYSPYSWPETKPIMHHIGLLTNKNNYKQLPPVFYFPN